MFSFIYEKYFKAKCHKKGKKLRGAVFDDESEAKYSMTLCCFNNLRFDGLSRHL